MKSKGESTIFDKTWEEYKKTYNSLNKLESIMQRHLIVTEDYIKSCSKVTIELSEMFEECEPHISKVSDIFAKRNAEIELSTFCAMKEFYDEQILKPLQTFEKINEELMKKRADYFKLLKKKQEKNRVLEKVRKNHDFAENKNRVRRNSVSRINIEKKSQKVEKANENYQEASTALFDIYDPLIDQLDSIIGSMYTGQLIQKPMTAFYTLQLYFTQRTNSKLKNIERYFEGTNGFKKILKKLEFKKEEENKKKFIIRNTGLEFGKVLTMSTPSIICDCIKYITYGNTVKYLFSNNRSKENIVQIIIDSYNNQQKTILNNLKQLTIYDVCEVFKRYFILLPETLIPPNITEEIQKLILNFILLDL